jgi:hypothetical protein
MPDAPGGVFLYTLSVENDIEQLAAQCLKNAFGILNSKPTSMLTEYK